MKLEAIDHLCIAVRDLDEARKRYEEDLGLELYSIYTSESELIQVARYYIGGVALELIAPISDESEVAKFLNKRGEGFYLISYRVEDVEDALAELKVKGVSTIDQRPRHLMGNRYAFIHSPRELAGVLTEVLDGEFDHDEGEDGQEADQSVDCQAWT
jgi:methylmalonyl-CoA/ethylmalonyl-CoA epimerase